jgi:hypothetical protein
MIDEKDVDRIREGMKKLNERTMYRDKYFYGLYNGLALALSIIEDREPEYLQAPPDCK